MTFSTFIPPAANQGIGVAFTDRVNLSGDLEGGNWFDLSRPDSADANGVISNFQILADLIECDRIALCTQVHGTQINHVGPDYPFLPMNWIHVSTHASPVADGMITNQLATALVVRVADCVPVLLANPASRTITAVHAGRVGLLAGVLQAAVKAMGIDASSQLQAWIGPHICSACYEVPPAMAQAAWELIPATSAKSRSGADAIDLGAGAQAILETAGVDVIRLDPCTSCDSRFFSYRRDHKGLGRQAGVIWTACLDQSEQSSWGNLTVDDFRRYHGTAQ